MNFSKKVLLALGALTLLAAAWAFYPTLTPYHSADDASFTVSKVVLERDHSDYWLTVHLKGKLPSQVDPDFGLLTPDKKLIRGMQADGELLPTRFWIHKKDLEHPLKLRLNGNFVTVKASQGLPQIANETTRTFHKSIWN